MSKMFYIPIIKTGDAEIRAVENLAEEVKGNITPLFELTRSRKAKNLPKGDIFRRLERLKDAYGEKQFILDLTAEPNLTNKQIESLVDNREGYKKWVEFVISIKDDFPEIIPTIQISDEGVDTAKEFYNRITKQVRGLDKSFGSIVYRLPLESEHYKEDLGVICNETSSRKVICIIDAGFMLRGKAEIYSKKMTQTVNALGQFELGSIIVAATSFPKNVVDYGGENEGDFALEEYLLYEKVRTEVECPVIYGDYATIHPVRSLQAGGRGWVPRIDTPTKDKIYYKRSRKRKLETSYGPAYTRVANRAIEDSRYRRTKRITGYCWGIEQIESAAEGSPQGLSPSFWISVRMNLHITLRKTVLSR